MAEPARSWVSPPRFFLRRFLVARVDAAKKVLRPSSLAAATFACQGGGSGILFEG